VIVLVGFAFIAVSAAGFWRMLPTDGKVHRLATVLFLESLLPLMIVAGFAIGAALVFAGVSIR